MSRPRNKNDIWREGRSFGPFAHSQVTVTTTFPKLFKMGSGREFVIQKVRYHNPIGLVQSATDFFKIDLKVGATILASWSTEIGQQGTIAADTFVDMVLNVTPANLKLLASAELTLVATKTGTQTLPIGSISVYGEEL